jgi:hypothetical protein
MTEELPDSAISSWGGFVYQGKIALFHSIKLLLDESFEGKKSRNLLYSWIVLMTLPFIRMVLQYRFIKLRLRHLIYRSAFEKALNKSSKICIDCCPNTKDTSISLMKLMILVIMKMRKKQ